MITTVLFVSPDADLRAVASRVLGMAGCRVTPVSHSGRALLACIAGTTFDVLVIEEKMADASGATPADRLRRYCPRAPVVWMCDAGAELPSGDIAVVRPFTADDLIGAVANATHYARRRATTR